MTDLAARMLVNADKARTREATKQTEDAAHRAKLYAENPEFVGFLREFYPMTGRKTPTYMVDFATGKTWGRTA